jgi:hypothetical protein
MKEKRSVNHNPRLRYTPNGIAVANMRLGSTNGVRTTYTNGWEDGETSFFGRGLARSRLGRRRKSAQG